MKKHLTKQEQEEHLRRWQEEGLSKNAYAIKAGINPRTFIGWTWGKAVKKKTGLVEVSGKILAGNMQGMIIEKGEVIIRVPLSIGVQELHTVLCALGGVE